MSDKVRKELKVFKSYTRSKEILILAIVFYLRKLDKNFEENLASKTYDELIEFVCETIIIDSNLENEFLSDFNSHITLGKDVQKVFKLEIIQSTIDAYNLAFPSYYNLILRKQNLDELNFSESVKQYIETCLKNETIKNAEFVKGKPKPPTAGKKSSKLAGSKVTGEQSESEASDVESEAGGEQGEDGRAADNGESNPINIDATSTPFLNEEEARRKAKEDSKEFTKNKKSYATWFPSTTKFDLQNGSGSDSEERRGLFKLSKQYEQQQSLTLKSHMILKLEIIYNLSKDVYKKHKQKRSSLIKDTLYFGVMPVTTMESIDVSYREVKDNFKRLFITPVLQVASKDLSLRNFTLKTYKNGSAYLEKQISDQKEGFFSTSTGEKEMTESFKKLYFNVSLGPVFEVVDQTKPISKNIFIRSKPYGCIVYTNTKEVTDRAKELAVNLGKPQLYTYNNEKAFYLTPLQYSNGCFYCVQGVCFKNVSDFFATKAGED